MEEASWMRDRGGDIMEEASWRRAWLARGGLRPGGVSGQKQCVLGCVFMVNVNYARGKPARELPRGHALSVFITLLAGGKAGRESDLVFEKLCTLAAGKRARKTLR